MSTPVLLISILGLTTLVWALGYIAGRARSTEQLPCPADGESRAILFERRLNVAWEPARPVDVLACSAFEKPTDIRCAKGCLGKR